MVRWAVYSGGLDFHTMVTMIKPSFGIDEVVAQLRERRNSALRARQGNERPPLLPSRQVLAEVVGGLAAALFPHRLGRPDLCSENIDHYVGYTLDMALSALHQQVRRELMFRSGCQDLCPDESERAVSVVQRFGQALPRVRELIDSDVTAAYQGDPAAGSKDEVLICYPGIWAMIHHRLAHLLYNEGITLTARVMAELAHSATGIDIHPGAQIGDHFFIDHGTGVVIGETAIIGRQVRLYQAVTLGAKRFNGRAPPSHPGGRGRHLCRRHRAGARHHRPWLGHRRQRLAHPLGAARQHGLAGRCRYRTGSGPGAHPQRCRAVACLRHLTS